MGVKMAARRVQKFASIRRCVSNMLIDMRNKRAKKRKIHESEEDLQKEKEFRRDIPIFTSTTVKFFLREESFGHILLQKNHQTQFKEW